jgi:hypothetical protein
MNKAAALATLAWAVLVSSALGCGVLYPELGTRIGPAPAIGTLDPPPPSDRHFLRVVGAKIPPRTRDGREWQQLFGSLPDPYAKVIVNEVELFRTSAEGDTLEPTWEGSPSGNFALSLGDELRIEVWDRQALNDHPIGVAKTRIEREMFESAEVSLEMSGGSGEVTLAIQPAKAVWGAGVWYELRNDSAYVTRVLDGSPAQRLGLRAGDRLVTLGGKPVDQMSPDEVRSLMSALPAAGLAMTVQHDDASTLQVALREGPIYPLVKDYDQLPAPPE